MGHYGAEEVPHQVEPRQGTGDEDCEHDHSVPDAKAEGSEPGIFFFLGAASKPAGPPPMPSSALAHIPTEIPLSAEAQFHYAQFLMAQVMAQAPPSHNWQTEEVEQDTLDQSDMEVSVDGVLEC